MNFGFRNFFDHNHFYEMDSNEKIKVEQKKMSNETSVEMHSTELLQFANKL